MTVYMVERDLAGIAMDDLAQAQRSAITTGKTMTAEGTEVRYIRSTFLPEEVAFHHVYGTLASDRQPSSWALAWRFSKISDTGVAARPTQRLTKAYATLPPYLMVRAF